jgi:hypothetical protein
VIIGTKHPGRLELSVAINCSPAAAYDFLALPENFPKWASGMDSAEGPARVRFSERNGRGVLDYSVTLPQGVSVYVPLRVVGKAGGCELVVTVFRQPGMSDEAFAAHAERAKCDLGAAKRILEASD